MHLTHISVTQNTYIPSVTGQVPQDANSEMDNGVQKVYWRVLLGLIPGGGGEGRRRKEAEQEEGEAGLQGGHSKGFS